tara:strand:- start:307 stop:615 length:309 start_codon:yes stop_codon:yes gene_type:complete
MKTAGLSVGIHTGMKISAFYTFILSRVADRDWTDEQILSLVMDEFPLREKVQPVRLARHKYNYGKQGFGFGEPLDPEDPRYCRQYQDPRVSGVFRGEAARLM